MLNVAIVRKTARDAAGLFVLAVIAILIFETMFVRAMGEFSGEMSQVWLQNRLVRRMVEMLVGYDLASDLTPTTLMTIGLAHPLLYTFQWSFLLTVCTRVIAGEIDRGTADLLFSLPVSRASVYVSTSVVWLAAGVVLAFLPVPGIALGQRLAPLWMPIDLPRLWLPAVNLYALYIAIGGITMLVSAVVVRRGVAVAIPLGIVLASEFVVFLAHMSPVAWQLMRVTLLYHYKPLVVLRSGAWPVGDMLTLLGIGATCWTAGLLWLRRRDIPAA